MLAFVFGLVVGAAGFWLLVVEKLRTDLYREKLAASVRLQRELFALFSAAGVLRAQGRPSQEAIAFYEAADLRLLTAAGEAALVLEPRILNLLGEICDYDHKQVRENHVEYVKALDRAQRALREDLEVDRLYRLTRFFSSPPPGEPAFRALTPAKDRLWQKLGADLKRETGKEEGSA